MKEIQRAITEISKTIRLDIEENRINNIDELKDEIFVLSYDYNLLPSDFVLIQKKIFKKEKNKIKEWKKTKNNEEKHNIV